MTDKPTPTDAELNTILCAHWPAFAAQSTLVKIWVRDAVQAAIDKWGQPAQATDPVAYVEVKQKRSEMSMTWWPEPAGFSLPTGRYRLYTTPQPTQTQPVAREPLTDGQIQDLLLCGNPTDEEMRLIRIGWDAAHGSKGGQHD